MSAHRRRAEALRALLAAAALGAATFAAAPGARAQTRPFFPDIKVDGQDYPQASYLPGQPIPVEIAVQCGNLCGVDADWWIWAQLPDGTILRYDGAAARWRPGAGPLPDAPSFQRPLAELPLAALPGTLTLPHGLTLLHFAVDRPMDGVLDSASDFYWEDYLAPYVWVDPGFFEDFDDGRAQGFARTPAGEWGVARRRFALAPTASPPAVALALHPETFSDFTFGASVRTVAGSPATLRRGVGLVFRAGAGYANAYVFHINARGYYTAFRRGGGVTVPLVRGWKFSPAIRRGFGRWNRLEVIARFDSLELLVNGVPVETVRDAGRLEGRAGVKAFGGDGDRFEFDDLLLRALFVE